MIAPPLTEIGVLEAEIPSPLVLLIVTFVSTTPKLVEPTVLRAPLEMEIPVLAELIVTLFNEPLPLLLEESCVKLRPTQEPAVAVGPVNVTAFVEVFAVCSLPPLTEIPPNPRAFTSTGPVAPSMTSVAPPGTVIPLVQIWNGLPAFVQVVVPAGKVPQTGVAAALVSARSRAMPAPTTSTSSAWKDARPTSRDAAGRVRRSPQEMSSNVLPSSCSFEQTRKAIGLS